MCLASVDATTMDVEWPSRPPIQMHRGASNAQARHQIEWP